VLAIGQLLVAGAGGRVGGRVTRGGGRVPTRVAPPPPSRPGEPLGRGLAVARTAAAAAGPCTPPPLPRRLPPPTLRPETPTPGFLT
jgi:hypothetical protein